METISQVTSSFSLTCLRLKIKGVRINDKTKKNKWSLWGSWEDSWFVSHFSAALCCVFFSSYTDEKAGWGLTDLIVLLVASLHRPLLCCLTHTGTSADLHHSDFYSPHIPFYTPHYKSRWIWTAEQVFYGLDGAFAHKQHVSLIICVKPLCWQRVQINREQIDHGRLVTC